MLQWLLQRKCGSQQQQRTCGTWGSAADPQPPWVPFLGSAARSTSSFHVCWYAIKFVFLFFACDRVEDVFRYVTFWPVYDPKTQLALSLFWFPRSLLLSDQKQKSETSPVGMKEWAIPIDLSQSLRAEPANLKAVPNPNCSAIESVLLESQMGGSCQGFSHMSSSCMAGFPLQG